MFWPPHGVTLVRVVPVACSRLVYDVAGGALVPEHRGFLQQVRGSRSEVAAPCPS